MTLLSTVYSMVTIGAVLASLFVESALSVELAVARSTVSSHRHATVVENQRIRSTFTSFPSDGYCGYPDKANDPWAEPLQVCGSNVFTIEECQTNAFYDTTTTCKWNSEGFCTSDAKEAGDFDPVCPSVTNESECCKLTFFGTRRCIWFEPPMSSPTISPSSSLRPSVAPSQTLVPSENPTHCVVPSFAPSISTIPTDVPKSSHAPTTAPLSPSEMPTFEPSTTPIMNPTPEPARAPTPQPTRDPMTQPILHPTKPPTPSPTMSPSSIPTFQPTDSPTEGPSEIPTSRPSQTPTRSPTNAPSNAPTEISSPAPTTLPSGAPVSLEAPVLPTQQPTLSPTAMPSPVPTRSPIDTTIDACICNKIRQCMEEPVVEEASSVGLCLKTQVDPIVNIQGMRLRQEPQRRVQIVIKDGNILSGESSISASSPRVLRVMIDLVSETFSVDLPIVVEGEVRVGVEKREVTFELKFKLKSNGVNPLTDPEDDDNVQDKPGVGDAKEEAGKTKKMMMWLIPTTVVLVVVIGALLMYFAMSRRRPPDEREYTRDHVLDQDDEVYTTMA